jgi:GEVED domain/SprB repeat/Secretion system C-terminal sorting domain
MSMNKFLQSALCFAALLVAGTVQTLQAQTTVTVVNGALVATGGTNGNPIYRSSAGSGFTFSFSSHIVTAAQLAAQGISPGSTINGMAFEKSDAATLSAGRTATLDVYVKNSALTAYAAGQTRGGLLTGATLAYTNTNQPISGGWQTIVFTAPIVYTGGSLEIAWDWGIAGAGASSTTGAFPWKYATSTSVQAAGTSNSVALTAASTCTNQTRSYNLQITYTAGAACTGTPAPGATTGPSAICPNTTFNVGIQNVASGSGITYQWQSSTNGTTYTDITGANNPSYSATQTAATYYQCIVTCAGNAATSTPLQVTVNPFFNCYCQTGIPSSTADEEILNVTIDGVSNASTCATLAPGAGSILQRYSNYVVGTTPTFTVAQASIVPFSVQVGTCGGNFNNVSAIWIDFDHSGTFDASEQLYSSAAAVNGPHVESGNLNIPLTALLGNTTMRVITNETGTPIAAGNACSGYTWGETEDYLINIIPSTACSGMPTGGTTNGSATQICSTTTSTVNFTIGGATTGSGFTYQWQSSPDNITWTNITGATLATLSELVGATTYYRRTITCTAAGMSDNSSAFLVTATQFACYCQTGIATSTADEEILGVSINGVTNTSTCATLAPGPGSIATRYSNYMNPTTPTFAAQQGAVVPFSVQVGTCGGNFNNMVAIWADFNQDGVWSATEQVFATTTAVSGPNTVTGTFTVPAGATLGITAIRVRTTETTAVIPASDACVNYTWGETEDYTISITTPPPCTNPVTAGATTANITTICNTTTSTINFSVSGAATGTGLTYQWQSSPDGITWTDVAGQTAYNYSDIVGATIHVRRAIVCSGGAVAYSTPVVVTASIFACYCQAGISNFTGDEEITSVVINGVTNLSTCTTLAPGAGSILQRYSNYMTPPTATFTAQLGATVPFSVEVGTCGGPFGNTVAIWIDTNHDGVWDASEQVFASATSVNGVNTVTGTFTVPTTALTGITAMRIKAVETTTPQAAGDACVNYGYGETEDYIINIACPAGGAATSNAPLCEGNNAMLMAGGSIPTATYAWSGPNGYTNTGSMVTITGATVADAGTYTVVSTFGTCVNTATVTVGVSKPVASITSASAPCFATNATATASATGGLLGYNYLWSNAAPTAALSALAGVYTVTVTDGVGCTATEEVILSEPALLEAVSSPVAIACFGGTSGSIAISPAGGTGPYSYVWSDGNLTDTQNNLMPGTYTVTITDANSCSTTATLGVTQPAAPLSINNAMTNVACFGGATGGVTATAVGGTSTYMYQWSNGPTAGANPGLVAGVYTVTATDLNGCTAATTTTITEPTLLVSTPSSTNISCFAAMDGTATANVSGGTTGYTYMWSNMLNTATISGLMPGTYTATVTDANGCSNTISTIITEPVLLVNSLMGTNATCFNSATGSTMAMTNGGTTPYTYSWSNDANITTNTNPNIFAGDYYVQVTDANGCTTTSSITITQAATGITIVPTTTNQTAPNNGMVMLDILGGNAPYTVLWANGATTTNLTGVPAGTYCATVTDATGCTQTACANVALIIETEMVANFTTVSAFPNPTEGPFTLSVQLASPQDVTVDIFAVTGQAIDSQTIKNTSNHNFSFDLSEMPSAMYFARIKAGTETKVIKISAVTK